MAAAEAATRLLGSRAGCCAGLAGCCGCAWGGGVEGGRALLVLCALVESALTLAAHSPTNQQRIPSQCQKCQVGAALEALHHFPTTKCVCTAALPRSGGVILELQAEGGGERLAPLQALQGLLGDLNAAER